MIRKYVQRVAVAAVVVIGQLVPAAGVGAVDDIVLPDLGMLPPRDFSIQSRPRGDRWLRFDSIVVNVGAGRFDVYGTQTSGSGDRPVVQRLQLAGGGWNERTTTAGMFYAGDGHDHWHVRDLQEWTIAFRNDSATVLRRGSKAGFCFWDNYRYPGTATSLYSGTTSCHEHSGRIPMGLTPGWGDEYPSTIAFQYIDITGLPNGDYVVTLTADHRGDFLEANETNNRSWAVIRISRKSVSVLETGTQVPPP